MAQTEYDILESNAAYADSTTARVTSVFSIGDSIIGLECEMQSEVEKNVMLPLVDLSAKLVKCSKFTRVPELNLHPDSCKLRAVVAIDPVTNKRSDKEILGFTYWENVKPGVKYKFYILYKGRINLGDEYLSIQSDDDKSYTFKDIRIDNSVESAFKICYVARPTRTVNVRKEASASSPVIGQVTTTQMLVAEDNLLDKPEFLKVVVLSTGKEGYVSRKYLSFEQKLPKASSGALTKIADKNINVDPEINIFNNTSITMKLTLSGKTYVFKPKQKRTVTVKAGNCSMIATGAGCSPYYGMEVLKEGCVYSWEFTTQTKLF